MSLLTRTFDDLDLADPFRPRVPLPLQRALADASPVRLATLPELDAGLRAELVARCAASLKRTLPTELLRRDDLTDGELATLASAAPATAAAELVSDMLVPVRNRTAIVVRFATSPPARANYNGRRELARALAVHAAQLPGCHRPVATGRDVHLAIAAAHAFGPDILDEAAQTWVLPRRPRRPDHAQTATLCRALAANPACPSALFAQLHARASEYRVRPRHDRAADTLAELCTLDDTQLATLAALDPDWRGDTAGLVQAAAELGVTGR